MPRTAPGCRHSYGLALVRFNEARRETEYLVVRRRTTFEYMDFVMRFLSPAQCATGPPDDEYLVRLLDQMTVDEKLDLLSLDFSRVYYRVWLCNPEAHLREAKERGTPRSDQLRRYLALRHRFTELFCLDGGRYLRALVQRSRSSGGVWEVPKGRKRGAREPDLNCAIREAREETGAEPSDYHLLPVPPVTLSHVGEGVRYDSTYFFAFHPFGDEAGRPRLNYFDRGQLAEIADLQWVSCQGARYLDPSGRLAPVLRSLARVLKAHCAVSRFVPHLNRAPPPVKSSSVEELASEASHPGGLLPAGDCPLERVSPPGPGGGLPEHPRRDALCGDPPGPAGPHHAC